MTTVKNDKWLDFSELYTCPYCGSRKKLKEYEIIKNKDGKMRQIICSICNEKMRKNTLINDITPYEWGEWLYLNIRIYNSHFYRFHDKVHMDLLVENLRLSPELANCFWDGWFHAKDEWNKGLGNRLLVKIEDKMYPKRKTSKLNGFFGGKSIYTQTGKIEPDIFESTQKTEKIIQDESDNPKGGG